MQRLVVCRLAFGIGIAVAAAALAISAFWLEPAVQRSAQQVAELKTELADKRAALRTFKKLIGRAPARALPPPQAPTAEHFRQQLARGIRERALAAGLRSPQLQVVQNAGGAASTPGLLPMPPDVADTVYFSFRAAGGLAAVVNFLRLMEDMPLAAGELEVADGVVLMQFAGWRVHDE